MTDSPPQRAGSPNPMLQRAFSLPISQRAWREVQKGPPSIALELQEKIPVTHNLAPGELLVKVEAAALNPINYKLMEMLPNTMARRPHTAGNDFTGTVVSSQGVTGFENGDPVCGWVSQSMAQITSQGSLCEYVRVRSDHVVRRPSNLSPIQAAGLCLAGLSAYKLLYVDAKIKGSGQRVLINNASGGVGTFAVQMAKASGCHVTASVSPATRELVLGLGADDVFDYHAEPIADALTREPPERPFDAIIDCYGLDSNLYAKSEHYLKPDGVFASVAPAKGSIFGTASAAAGLFTHAWRPKWMGGTQRKLSMLNLENSKEELRALAAMVESGKVVPVVDSVFKFDDVQMAFERLQSGHAHGKVVVVVNADLYLEQKQTKLVQ
ncbi:hypothetical protein PIIN_00746 [Serendipita indica DSM 11827]|uniref:Enoyl reductase (ER) domain-containing protein n=1 Tax=Serendipita indica (strain DSM 11827) TaxID=1109443 RepID=G4T6E0_SERID|nr:hypothetical protein PIIN_00746 [Serendipita indica DSM 11827]